MATVSAGYPFRGKIPSLPEGEVRVVQMKDVSPQGEIQWEHCVKTALNNSRQPEGLSVGDILVAARGNRNYAVLVGEDCPKSIVLAAPHFYVVSVNRAGVLPEYLVWWLNQVKCQRYFEQSAEGTLTKSIRRTVLEEVEIVLPDIEQQRIITALASTVAKERRAAEQLIANGEQMLAAIACGLASGLTHE
ncbi:restriction endonuclease subunit S [Enterobacteriaceae bacterium RIT691]|nr:restriction endonuclease subunit S [Enterobacteriaceae bacterium RIT691]